MILYFYLEVKIAKFVLGGENLWQNDLSELEVCKVRDP